MKVKFQEKQFKHLIKLEKGCMSTDSKSTDKSGSKSTDKSGSKSTDKSGSKSTDTSGSKSTDTSGSKSTDKSDSKSTDKSGSKSTDKSDSKSTDKSDSKSTDKSDSKSTDKSGSKCTDKMFWDKIFAQDTDELTKRGIKPEKIEWADSLCKTIQGRFQIKLFTSYFPLYGYMYSKSKECCKVYQWQVVADAVGWYQDSKGLERYVIVKQITVPESLEFWANNADAYGKCLHQCLVQARLLQLHLKLEYLPHILIIPISGKTVQDIHPGHFFDYPENCKEVINSFEWIAGLPKSPSSSFVSR